MSSPLEFNGKKLTPITEDLSFNGKKLTPIDSIPQTQYSGGFNKPQQEADYPFKNAVDTIKWAGGKLTDGIDYIEKMPTVSEFITRNILTAKDKNFEKAYKAKDMQQEAIDAMKSVDALDETSLYSNILKNWTQGENPSQALEAQQRLYKAYNDEFVSRGLGQIGKGKDNKLYLITKDGTNLPLDSLVDNIQGDLKANEGVMAGAMAGFQRAPSFANPYLTFASKAGGSAIGALGGSIVDTGKNSYKTLKDFDAKFALNKATQEAGADAIGGVGLEGIIKGFRAGKNVVGGLRDWLARGNVGGAESHALDVTKKPIKDVHAERSLYENTPSTALDKGLETKQDQLASTAMENKWLWNEVAPTIMGDAKASTAVADTVTDRANKLIDLAKQGAITEEELLKSIKGYEDGVHADYSNMIDDLEKILPDYRVPVDDVKNLVIDTQNQLGGSEIKGHLNVFLNELSKKSNYTIRDLYDLRKELNSKNVEDFTDRVKIRNLNDALNSKIEDGIDTIPDKELAQKLKDGFEQNRANYKSMFDMQDSPAYRDIYKNSISQGDVEKGMLKYAKSIKGGVNQGKDIEQNLNDVLKHLQPEKRAGAEMNIITNLIKENLLVSEDGMHRAVDFKRLLEQIKSVQTSNLKSQNAKDLIEFVRGMSNKFDLDTQLLNDVKHGRVKGLSEGIGTDPISRLKTARANILTKIFIRYLPFISQGRSSAFKHHVLDSLRKARTATEFINLSTDFPDVPPSLWRQIRPLIKEYEKVVQQEQAKKAQQVEAERIAKEERIAKQQAEKEAKAQALEKEVKEFKQPSTEELNAVEKLTRDDRFGSFAQKIRRIMDGTASEVDKKAYLEAKSKISKESLDNQIYHDTVTVKQLEDIRANKAEYDSIVKQISGEPEKVKSKTQSEIDSLNSEDAQAEAYSQRFDGNEYEDVNPYGISKADEKAWLDGKIDEATRERVYQAILKAKEDGFEAKPIVKNPILKDIVPPKVNHIVEQPTIQGSSTAKQSQEAMMELQQSAPKKTSKPKKQKTYSEDEDVAVSSEMTEFKKELLDETGVDESTLTSSQSWNKTGKVKQGGFAVDMGIADFAMRKVNNEILAPHYPKGFVPNKNIPTGSAEAKDSYDVFRGRSVAGRMDGKNKAYIDGLVFDVIEPEKSPFKPNQFIKTTGDKYAVAQGISSIIDDTFPKMAEEADIVIEPYGASLSFVSNLNFAKKMLKQGKNYYVSVSSYFEPEKSLIYNAIKQGNGKDIRSSLSGLLYGEDRGQYAKELRKLFTSKTKKGYALNEVQIKTALYHFHVFEDILSYPNLHLMDKLDNHVFNMAKEEANKGTKVVFIDDSNYASLPFERSGDVYNDPLEGFRRMVKDGQMSQADLDKTVKFAQDNNVPLDDQFGKNPQYLLWQKQETYDALTKNNGIIIGTNNASPELVRGLSKYDGNIKVFWHQANHVPDQELGIAMRNKRPEYLAIFGGKNGTFTVNETGDSLYKGTRFDDFGTTSRSSRPSQEVRQADKRGITEPKRTKTNTSDGDAIQRGKSTRGLEKSRTVNDFINTILKKPVSKEDYVNKKLQVASSEDAPTTYPTMNGETLPKADKQGNFRNPYNGDIVFSYDTLMKALSNKKPNKKDAEILDYIKKLGL